MATNNINISPYYPLNPIPNPPLTFEDCVPRLEDILLKVVNIRALVCPLSKKFFSDPVRLPCGHVFERVPMTEWYNNYSIKICPITFCQKPYDYLRDQEDADPLRKELAQSFNKEMHQPSERVKNKIYELYKVLGDSQEKQQIKEAIDLFCSGQLSQGIHRMNQISMRSANSHLYLPILNLMKMQMQSVSVQINHLIQQAGLPPVEQSQIQPFLAPVAGAGMPQSLFSPSLNGVGSAQLGNFYLAPRPIQQDNLPKPKVGNSPIRNFSSPPIIDTRSGMPQSPLSPSGASGMGLQQPIPFNPQAPMQKIQEDKGNVANSDEQRFILIIKTGTCADVYKYINSNKNLNLEMVIDEEGNTPLLWIAKNHLNPKKVTECLLKAGADPNAQNNQGQTALHLIATSQVSGKRLMPDVIDKFIKWGACIDSRDKQGQTAFQLATKNGKRSIARALDPNQSLKRPLENASDLSKAKHSRSEPSTHSPLTFKNRENSENSDSEAREAGNEEATNSLNLQVMGSAGTGNFYLAPRPIQQGNLPELRSGNSQLQDFPAPVIDTRSGMPQSPLSPSGWSGMGLQQSIPFNSQASMKKIQENREGVNSKAISLTPDERDFIQLIGTTTKGFPKFKCINNFISEKNLNVNMVIDEEGNTPLLWIVKNLQHPKKSIEALLKAGANPNAQNNQGQTVFHLIAESKVTQKDSIVSVINMLVEGGGCVDGTDKKGQTAFLLATKNGKIGVRNRPQSE